MLCCSNWFLDFKRLLESATLLFLHSASAYWSVGLPWYSVLSSCRCLRTLFRVSGVHLDVQTKSDTMYFYKLHVLHSSIYILKRYRIRSYELCKGTKISNRNIILYNLISLGSGIDGKS
jgi:hypothetical protein